MIFFAWFEGAESKSRVNFLSLLRAGAANYILNEDAFEYMEQKRLPKSPLALLLNHPVKKFMDTEQWEQHLKGNRSLPLVNLDHSESNYLILRSGDQDMGGGCEWLPSKSWGL